MGKRDESKIRHDVVRAGMQSWHALSQVVATFTENEVMFAFELENEREERRPSMVRRLTQRLRQIKIDEVNEELSRDKRTKQQVG